MGAIAAIPATVGIHEQVSEVGHLNGKRILTP